MLRRPWTEKGAASGRQTHLQRRNSTLHATDLVVRRLLLRGLAVERLQLAVDQQPVAAHLDVFLVRVVKLHTLRH